MQVVVRALTVLRAVAGSERGASLQELHERLGIPVGSVHRLLGTLLEQDYVARSPTSKRYFLGPAARQLGVGAPCRTGVLATPHQAVREAAEASGETVYVAELVGGTAICVACVEGRHPLRLCVPVGRKLPLHTTTAGRALLAWQPADTVNRLVAGALRDDPIGFGELMARLDVIRERGYDLSDADGIWVASAPVLEAGGEPIAAVALAAASVRTKDALVRATAARTVLAAARAMSADLGFSGEWPEVSKPTWR